jgi:hypothetical protein
MQVSAGASRQTFFNEIRQHPALHEAFGCASVFAAQVFAKLPSMDGVFQKIAEGYAKPADRITLTLNQNYGFLEHIYIDYVAMIADEELIYTITEFTH